MQKKEDALKGVKLFVLDMDLSLIHIYMIEKPDIKKY